MILFSWRVAEPPLQNFLKTAVHLPVFQKHLLVMIPFILVKKMKRRVSLFLKREGKKSFCKGFVGFLLSHAML